MVAVSISEQKNFGVDMNPPIELAGLADLTIVRMYEVSPNVPVTCHKDG